MQSLVDRYLPPDTRRIKPVRVADVPVSVRRRAASTAAKQEHSAQERLRLRMLAEDPGELIAWIAA
jgi:hypothetical protein